MAECLLLHTCSASALEAAYNHTDVTQRLTRDGWDAKIFDDTDDENPHKLMAIMEMLTGLKTNLTYVSHLPNAEGMKGWLGQRIKWGEQGDTRPLLQPPLFAFNKDKGLRPLSVESDGNYIVRDCRAPDDTITPGDLDDLQGLNVKWSAEKLYGNTTWFVRMDPSSELSAFANSASAREKIPQAEQQLFEDYWKE